MVSLPSKRDSKEGDLAEWQGFGSLSFRTVLIEVADCDSGALDTGDYCIERFVVLRDVYDAAYVNGGGNSSVRVVVVGWVAFVGEVGIACISWLFRCVLLIAGGHVGLI